MSDLMSVLRVLLVSVPFVLLALLGKKDNLKPQRRSRQGLMSFVAVVFCVVAGLLLNQVIDMVVVVMRNLNDWLEQLSVWVAGLFDGKLAQVAQLIDVFADKVEAFIRGLDLPFWGGVLANGVIILAYLIFKRIAITLLRPLCREGVAWYDSFAGLVYEKRTEDGGWYVKSHMIQGITLTKVLYYVSIVFGMAGIGVSAYLFEYGLISSLYFPVFSVILVGELYFFLDGPLWDPEATTVTGEAERKGKFCDYTFLRQVLCRLFGDKLLSDNTTTGGESLVSFRTNDELFTALEEDNEVATEAYGVFMRHKAAEGLDIDQNYLMSGLDLLKGKSVIFNNPFYYDLVPYIFYPMNRAILRRKKVLIVLGRHAIEEDVANWCREGLAEVNYIPSLWNIGVLGREEQNLDVGIVTRSDVHDLALHEANANFFAQVDFVMLIEPSRLIATAQIGLNSLVRYCRRDGNAPVFCSSDKNCDGLVDALSHILMTSLEEVSATNRHRGISSYMCWEADEEHLQHRMLPNISRYLGGGTELSFAALKMQVSQTAWYGGDAFPVTDVHWIAKQYYYDLMRYAALPTQQSLFGEVFTASPNMWDARVKENHYLTVEDENFNMYEIKRDFSTRATNQGFINVISTDYLLKDYMTANDGIFDADSKAIPYIVADYAHTDRNVIYRLFLRLTALFLTEEDIRRELALINVDLGRDPVATLWGQVCKISQGVGVRHFDSQTGREQLHIAKGGDEYIFDDSVIRVDQKYVYRTGVMETVYSIRDKQFIDVFLGDLCSAQYVAEDETGENRFLGTELWGHIFQKYLPGQFFTFGGKYYEMLGLTLDGRVMVRRAADHITGRPQYRQVREYVLNNVVDAAEMGALRDLGSFRICRQHADIAVRTPAYWQMARYNDFSTAKKIAINGVPVREYRNKHLLRVDFAPEVVGDKKVLDTLALLMNEVFRTLYAENQGMIVAVTAGQAEAPLSYSLEGGSPNSIYIIEDSQLDIGFLVSVERNLSRILATICDYLEWHTETLEISLHPPVPEEKPEYAMTDEERAEEAKNRGIRGFFRRVGRGLKKAWDATKNFFGKLFRRKPKDEEQPPAEAPAAPEGEEEASVTETPAAETPATESPAPEKKKGSWLDKFRRKRKGEEPVTATEPVPTPEAAPAEAQPGIVDVSGAEGGAADEAAAPALRSMAPPKALYRRAARLLAEEAAADATASEEEGEPAKPALPARKPYHERYYLLYGGTEEPATLNVAGALEVLRQLGFGRNALEQVRTGKSELEAIERDFDPHRPGSHFCDFCGTELFGAEYETLVDGRERCMLCGRSTVKDEKEYQKIFDDVVRNMATFFGITFNAPVKVQMVNAKRLHKALGHTFTPTGQQDGRILGVAIHDKKKGYSILLENGTPRLNAVMTTVHEMTHIWQYLNWDAKQIKQTYGNKLNLQVYEGMAKWVEIQYTYLLNERATAKREELMTRMREDEYGFGFLKYAEVYPLSYGTRLQGDTPFDHPEKPL